MTPPLVFVHGFTGLPDVWDDVVAMLGGRNARRVLVSGHGPDPTPARAFESEVEAIADACAAIGPVHLVGYSLGARLCLGVLASRPGLAVGATLVGVHPGLSTAEARHERLAADERWASMLERDGLDAFVEAWSSQPLFASQHELPPDAAIRQRALRRSHTAAGLASSLRRHGLARMPDYRPSLRSIRVPVTLVAGGRDLKFTALAADLARALPDARLELVPGAGHNVVLEQPRVLATLLQESQP